MDERQMALGLIEDGVCNHMFDDVRRTDDFNGMHAFMPLISGGRPAYIGLPGFIIIDNGRARWSTYDEIMERMHQLSADDDAEDEE